MDKFKGLEEKLKETIKSLENQIALNQEKQRQSEQERSEVVNEKNKLENKLNELVKKLDFLKFFNNKSISLETIKRIWVQLWNEINNQNTFQKILSILAFLVLIALSCIDSVLMFTIIGSVVFLNVLASVFMIYTVKKERKKHSIEELEQELKDTEEEYELAKEKEKKLNKRISEIDEVMKKLESEKNKYAIDLQDIETERIKAIESLVSENDLNDKFEEQKSSGTIARIRAREKKEGEE